VSDWNTGVINEFRDMVGKPKDRKVGGMFTHDHMVLLHTTGAKTGNERITPLASVRDDQNVYVTASKGGAPAHPDWFRNVLAHPAVTVEIGDETVHGTARNVDDRAKRDRLYQRFIDMSPGFAEYEEKAGDRVIPVVEITVEH
jgi:deazaflavin-dependent oxidoreductase (nitroreductase family)